MQKPQELWVMPKCSLKPYSINTIKKLVLSMVSLESLGKKLILPRLLVY